MGELQDFIPDELRDRIVDVGGENVIDPVFRVDKEGILSERFLLATFQELPGRYPDDEIGTYSTSVYDIPEPCLNFIKSMGKRIREMYPCPVVRKGNTQYGLVAKTADYKEGYRDINHIDWWIFKGQEENALKNFGEIYP